jgi:hypothetical protein
MDLAMRSGAIQLLGGCPKLRLRLLEIALRHGFANFSNLSLDGRFNRAIPQSAGFILAKPFLGAFGSRHTAAFSPSQTSHGDNRIKQFR